MSFVQKSENSLNVLGLGKTFRIKEWLDERNVIKYKINEDLSIDVNWSVDLKYIHEGNFPDYIQFNKINGFFDCGGCEMTTLKGSPKSVLGVFRVSHNPLTTLEFSPKTAAAIACYNNNLVEDFKNHILDDSYNLKNGCY